MCGNEQTTVRRQLKLSRVRSRSPTGAPPPDVARHTSVPAGTPIVTLPARLIAAPPPIRRDGRIPVLSDGVIRDG